MPFNGSDLINEPWNTTFSPYTDLFDNLVGGAGALFYLFPLSFIAIALYVKTRDPVVVSMFMLASGALCSGGSIWIGAIEMSLVFTIFAALGLAGLFISLFFKK